MSHWRFHLLLLVVLAAGDRAGADSLVLLRPLPVACVTGDSAVYTVRDGELHPVRGEFWTFPQGQSALRPRAIVPREAVPGSLVKVWVESEEPLDSVSLELALPGATVHAAGFAETETPGVWEAFLGLPTWQAPGTFSLALRASAGGRAYLDVQPLIVHYKQFRMETFRLGTDLTNLVTTNPAQTERETRILITVLTTPHPDAIYETGTLRTPFAGARRTSGYGDRRQMDYADGSKSNLIHLGVDIAAAQGTPVPSSGRGRVVFAGKRILTGNTVIIEHLPGLFSVYYHLSAIGVEIGQVVDRGQIIGKVGMTGFATGPHLHWEIEAMGVAVDPDEAAESPLQLTFHDHVMP